MYWTIDIGNGDEGYQLPSMTAALEKAQELVTESYWENYDREMSCAYTGWMEFTLLNIGFDLDENPVLISKKKGWADAFGNNNFYRSAA